jgi:hypothetical protein
MGISRQGTIALIQSQDYQIRFFAADGANIGAVGQRGAGPGEFQRPVRGGWIGDTLWVSDSQLNRVMLISPSHAVIRTLPPLRVARPKAADADQIPHFPFVFPHAIYPGDTILAVGIGAAGDPLAEALEGTPLVRVSSDGWVDRVVLHTPHDEGAVQAGLNGGYVSATIPYFPRPLWSVSPDGSHIVTLVTNIAGSEAGTFTVSLYRAVDGLQLYTRTLPFESVAIPASVIDSVMADRIERAPRPELRRLYETEVKARIPSVYPPVVRVFVGHDGRVWIGLRTTPEGNAWIVLGREGEPTNQILVPSNVVLHVANSTHVWGLERDEVGVESVVRFPLPAEDLKPYSVDPR